MSTRPTSLVTGRRAMAVLFAAATLGALLFFLATIPAGLPYEGDAVKFGFLGRTLGIAHPTGYPTYTLLLWAFSWLPIGSLAFRATLVSAVASALAAGFTALILVRLTGSRLIALIGAAAFTVTPTFWSQAVQPEVYALHLAFLSAALAALLAWDASRERRWLLIAAGIVAFSGSHHALIVTALPAIALYCLLTDRRQTLSPPTLAWFPLFIALGLAPYAYLFWRTAAGAPYQESEIRTLADLLDYLSGSDWKSEMFSQPALVAANALQAARWLIDELTVFGVAAAAVGLGALWPQRRVLALLGGVLLGDVFFSINYNISDIRVYYIPAYFVAVLAAAVGVTALVNLGGRTLGASRALAIAATILTLWAGVILRETLATRPASGFDDVELTAFTNDLQAGSYVFMPPSYVWFERFSYQIYGATGRGGDDIWLMYGWSADDLRRALAGEVVSAAPFRGEPKRRITRVYVAPDQPQSAEAGFRPTGELRHGNLRLLYVDLPGR